MRLRAHGHQVVNFFHLVVVLASVKYSGNVHQILLSRYFRKELKQRIWGRGLPWEGPLGSCSGTQLTPTFNLVLQNAIENHSGHSWQVCAVSLWAEGGPVNPAVSQWGLDLYPDPHLTSPGRGSGDVLQQRLCGPKDVFFFLRGKINSGEVWMSLQKNRFFYLFLKFF